MKYDFSPKGVCPLKLEFGLDGDKVRNIQFHGGCNGNLKALSILAEGMTVDEIEEKLLGIHCGIKDTSCSDQLARAVIEASRRENAEGGAKRG